MAALTLSHSADRAEATARAEQLRAAAADTAAAHGAAELRALDLQREIDKLRTALDASEHAKSALRSDADSKAMRVQEAEQTAAALRSATEQHAAAAAAARREAAGMAAQLAAKADELADAEARLEGLESVLARVAARTGGGSSCRTRTVSAASAPWPRSPGHGAPA